MTRALDNLLDWDSFYDEPEHPEKHSLIPGDVLGKFLRRLRRGCTFTVDLARSEIDDPELRPRHCRPRNVFQFEYDFTGREWHLDLFRFRFHSLYPFNP